MNMYKKAIEQNEVTKFFRDQEEYFESDRDLSNVLNIIWVYLFFRKEDDKFKIDWIISPKILESVFMKIKGLKNDEYNIDRKITSLKERFDLEIKSN
jgi:hypothetical protein